MFTTMCRQSFASARQLRRVDDAVRSTRSSSAGCSPPCRRRAARRVACATPRSRARRTRPSSPRRTRARRRRSPRPSAGGSARGSGNCRPGRAAFFESLKSRKRPSEKRPVASGRSSIGGPPTSCSVKPASILGLGSISPVFSSVTASAMRSGTFRPGSFGVGHAARPVRHVDEDAIGVGRVVPEEKLVRLRVEVVRPRSSPIGRQVFMSI